MHEALVTGHVDERRSASVALLEVREAEIDGDAAPLLLGQAIAVDAGERLDQRRLAVVDVAGGADGEAHGAGLSAVVKGEVAARLEGLWGNGAMAVGQWGREEPVGTPTYPRASSPHCPRASLTIPDSVLPSTFPAKRAESSFIAGPIAFGPERPAERR